jgi:hypothetical protein
MWAMAVNQSDKDERTLAAFLGAVYGSGSFGQPGLFGTAKFAP